MLDGEPIRIARTSTQADEWALVLMSAGIPHAVTPDGAGWTVRVDVGDVDRALAALAAYDREAVSAASAAPPPAVETQPYPWMSGVTVGLLLLGAFGLTGPAELASRWFERGAAVAGRVIGDEPWRAITALTLHTDAVHVLGNAVATAVLLPPLVQRLGIGVALWLLLIAGALGNVGAALVHEVRHSAVGASTATFGAIGALAAMRMLPPATVGLSRRRGWVPVAAALLLLVLMGTAPRADVVAHVLGLASGLGVGLLAATSVRSRPGTLVQCALTALAIVTIAAAWRLALTAQ